MTKIKMRSAQVMILTFAVLSVVSSGDPRPPGHSTYPSSAPQRASCRPVPRSPSPNAVICFNCDHRYEGIDPFHDAAVWVGGAVNPGRQATVSGPGQFEVLGGKVAVTVETDADFFTDELVATILGSRASQRGRSMLQARLCSAAAQIAAADATGVVTGGEGLELDCNARATSPICYLDISAQQLTEAEGVAAIHYGAFEDIVLRVRGAGVVTYDALDTSFVFEIHRFFEDVVQVIEINGVPTPTTVTVRRETREELDGDPRLLLVFEEAAALNVVFPRDAPGPAEYAVVFAPFAESVTVVAAAAEGPFREARFFVGPQTSTLTFLSQGRFATNAEDTFNGILPIFDSSDVQLFYCDCVCDPKEGEEEEARLRCVDDDQFRRADEIAEEQRRAFKLPGSNGGFPDLTP
eukprot:Selendium_serpulae@DN6358_c0_g1_i13.p1